MPLVFVMAAGSESVSFKKYGVKHTCYGCQRKLGPVGSEPLWFRTVPTPAVYGHCCWTKAAA